MLHNESVNVWSHLFGVFMVLILATYTAMYVQSHKKELLQSLHLNMTDLSEEIRHVTDPVLSMIPKMGNFSDLSESVLNKTQEYITMVDEKVGIYQKYVKCKECFAEIVHTLGDVKDNLSRHMKEYKDKILDGSIHILEKIEDSKVGTFVEENMKVLGEKISDLKAHLKELPWMDIYSFEGNEMSNKLARWPVFVFLISAVICLGCSAIFHWLGAHSRDVHQFLNRLDYAGISILIMGSCYPPYFYFFHCEIGKIFFYN